MNRADPEHLIETRYGVQADYPWDSHPQHAVFRHARNRKWFALIMDLPRGALGPDGDGTLTAVNRKCNPLLIGSFRQTPGIFPAYHMNKDHWITVALDGSVADDTVEWLLDISADLTRPPIKKRP